MGQDPLLRIPLHKCLTLLALLTCFSTSMADTLRLNQLIQLAEDASDPEEKALHYLELGDHYVANEINYYLAIRHYTTALPFAPSLDIQAEINYKIGFCYESLGEYEASAKFFVTSLEGYSELQDTTGMVAAWLGLGGLHSELGELEVALEQLEKAESMCRSPEEDSLMVQVLNTQGVIYRRKKDYDCARESYQRTLASIGKRNDRRALINYYVNMGVLAWKAEKDADEAFAYTDKAIHYAREYGMRFMECVGLSNRSYILFKVGRLEEANSVALQSLEIAIEVQEKEFELRIYQGLSETAEKLNRPEEALMWYKKYISLSDSLGKVESKRQVREVTEKYGNEQLSLELEALRKQALIDELTLSREMERSRNTRRWSFAGIIATLLVLGSTIVFFRYRQSVAGTLEKKDAELAYLQAREEGQWQERQRLATELHDGIGSLLTGIKMKLSGIPDQNQVLSPIVDQMAFLGEELRKISHDLVLSSSLDLSLRVKELMADLFEKTPTETVIEFINPSCLKSLGPELNLQLWRISQELIHNIARHAKADNVLFSMTMHDNRVDLLIEDDGTGKVRTNGFGLKNVAERVRQLGGDLQVDFEAGRGTTMLVSLELNVIPTPKIL